MLAKIFSKIFGDPNQKELKKLDPLVAKINSLEAKYKKYSDEKLRAETFAFKERLRQGDKLDVLLPQAFAVCREAGVRVLGLRAYDNQLLGAIALHQGKIAELKTGEGKTFAAVFATYLNALAGRGVHIITVNDYLSRRDTNWMGAVYHFLGLSVGCIGHDVSYLFDPQVKPDASEVSIEYQNLKECPRREAYNADVTYGTNNEFGFDYLRDNMVLDSSQMVQVRDLKSFVTRERELLAQNDMKNGANAKNSAKEKDGQLVPKKSYLNFAIVDEVDSILIDEARTPLIISAPDEESTKLYNKFAKIVPKLSASTDYNVDEKMQSVVLTDEGMNKIERLLGVDNIYTSGGIREVHHLQQALKAHVLFKRDKQYVVRDGEVIIVDDFTGRLMPGRRFSEGLHQALEAKEGVAIQRESKTLATITFQNYFRLYQKLAGMTGTAITSAEEFHKVYKLEVLSAPTHKKMVRVDLPDKVYKNERGKFKAIVAEIRRRHKKGQPVLVGTISVEKSEALSQFLKREGIEHEVLNAKNHEREANIIANAGQYGGVTIATNMAGRGTDIKLGDRVTAAGGLHILGTERHEARRIDDQLRGRSGRQGDPGSSQFYVSLEDELMRRFGSDKIKGMMDALGLPDDQPIQNKMISRSIESAQKKIEGFNFDIRKHVLEYDDVMNRQREAIYQKRRQILLGILDRTEVEKLIAEVVDDVCATHTHAENVEDWNTKEIFEHAVSLFGLESAYQGRISSIVSDRNDDPEEKQGKLKKLITEASLEQYRKKEEMFGASSMRQLERVVMLRILDTYWMEHLDNMSYLREGIGLRGYGQRDPLVEYKKEGFSMYVHLLKSIRLNTVEALFKAGIYKEGEPVKSPSPPRVIQLSGADEAKSGFEEASSAVSVESSSQTDQRFDKEHIGRNDPCPCGSGKKYKKCHGK